jgi:hypothetical protein
MVRQGPLAFRASGFIAWLDQSFEGFAGARRLYGKHLSAPLRELATSSLNPKQLTQPCKPNLAAHFPKAAFK